MDQHKHHQQNPDFGKEVKDEFHEAVEVVQEMTNPGKFDIAKEFKNALEIIKFSPQMMHKVAISKKASLGALTFIVLTIIVSNFASYLVFFRFGLLQMVFGNVLIIALITFITFVVSVFVYDFVGSYFFKGKGDFKSLFRVLGYGYLVMLLSVIPVLTVIASIWYLIVTYKALVHVKKLDATNSVLTILIGIVVVAIIGYIVTSIFGGGIFASYYGLEHSLIR